MIIHVAGDRITLVQCFKSNFTGIFKFSNRWARVLWDFWKTPKATLIHVPDMCHIACHVSLFDLDCVWFQLLWTMKCCKLQKCFYRLNDVKQYYETHLLKCVRSDFIQKLFNSVFPFNHVMLNLIFLKYTMIY